MCGRDVKGLLLAQVPAVILVCRNSTDTAYFQRLRPYPRIMLLRYNTRFKDYVSFLALRGARKTVHLLRV